MRLFILFFLIFSLIGCHVEESDSDDDDHDDIDRHNSVVLVDNYESGKNVAIFYLHQTDEGIFLKVKNITNKTITVGFKLWIGNNISYVGSLENVDPNETINFKEISNSKTNISETGLDVYQTTDVTPSLLETSNT